MHKYKTITLRASSAVNNCSPAYSIYKPKGYAMVK